MEIFDLEEEIKIKLSELDNNLSSEEKNDFHFKSVHNFVEHIFKNSSNSKKSSQLKKVNLKRNQEMILEYLDLIIDGKVSKDDSTFLFKKYIKVIGEFMNRNYGFSFAGGKIKYLLFLLYATLGAILDLICWYFLKQPIYIFTLVFLIYSISITYIKFKNNKLYGPNF